MLGIIIGVGSVVVIMAVGAGAQSLVLSQVQSLGTNLVGVIAGHSEDDSAFGAMMGFSVTTLTYEDALALKNDRDLPYIVDIAAHSKSAGPVSWGANSYDTTLSGTTVGYLVVESGEVEEGRFFNSDEERNFSRVVVLGYMVRQELFGESEAIGKRIKIKKQSFEVIGVMEERGMVAMQDYDDQVFIPIKTMQRLVGVNNIGLMRIKVDDAKNIPETIENIKLVLRDRHDISDQTGRNDDFTVKAAEEILEMIATITDGLRYFLAMIAALSLIVGGIGIMNIMLISVSERTREIGLRKAIGANNFNILTQFLIESVVITVTGGIIGIFLGVIIALLISVGAGYAGYDWAFIVSPLSIVLAVLVSSIIGVVFGLYPAIRASKLDPIEALRYE